MLGQAAVGAVCLYHQYANLRCMVHSKHQAQKQPPTYYLGSTVVLKFAKEGLKLVLTRLQQFLCNHPETFPCNVSAWVLGMMVMTITVQQMTIM